MIEDMGLYLQKHCEIEEYAHVALPTQVSLLMLKPHCIQSSRVLVPAGTSKSTLRRHGIQVSIKDARIWQCRK
jgi:hypothetical protein